MRWKFIISICLCPDSFESSREESSVHHSTAVKQIKLCVNISIAPCTSCVHNAGWKRTPVLSVQLTERKYYIRIVRSKECYSGSTIKCRLLLPYLRLFVPIKLPTTFNFFQLPTSNFQFKNNEREALKFRVLLLSYTLLFQDIYLKCTILASLRRAPSLSSVEYAQNSNPVPSSFARSI